MNKYKIAVYAICKNEEKFIDRWVNSMQEADEIVVVDTGSTDNSVEKLKSRGVKVYSSVINPWRFDVARNISLEFVSQDVDICIATDLDEVFDSGWREKLESEWQIETTRAFYTFIASFNADGTPDKIFMKEKIHARHLYKWINPVHEILEYIGDKQEVQVSIPSIVLRHYPDFNKSREQYLSLLELSIDENPNDDRNMHYLGREYMYRGIYDKAIDTLKRHLNMPTATWKDERCASMRFIARCYLAKEEFETAEEWYLKAIKEAPYTREPYTELAALYNKQENWQGTYNMVKSALNITGQLKTYLLEGFCWDHTLYFLGGVSSFWLKKYNEALEYSRRAVELASDNKTVKDNYDMVYDFVSEMNGINYNKVSIIMVTYNNLDESKRCLDSIRKYTMKKNYEIIVVDNMSMDITREWLITEKDIKVILNNEKMSIIEAFNIGIKLAEKDNDILFINNDIEVCYKWLRNLQIALVTDSKIGAVAAVTYSDFDSILDDDDNPFDFGDDNIQKIQSFAKLNNISDLNRWQYSNRINDFCLLVKREVINKIGNLDENFVIKKYGFYDICLRIMKEGFYLRTCYDVYVHLYKGNLCYEGDKKYNELLNRDKLKLKEKWGVDLNSKDEVQNNLIMMIEADENREINILHWNCGLGETLLAVKSRYPKANLYGIDENENYNNITNKIIMVSNSRDFPIKFMVSTNGEFIVEGKEKIFDYILIGDELEKTNEVKVYLENMSRYLKDDGCIIASMQNIMYYKVIKNLISEGRWQYNNRGFLNIINTNFFTEDDIIKFIDECGYKINLITNWNYVESENDEKYIEKLCEIGGKDKEDLYKTYNYTISFTKN